MKKTTARTSERVSKGPARRMPSAGGDGFQGTSSQAYRKSGIPLARGRSSSADRLSHNAVDLTLTNRQPRRSRSVASSRGSATPQCNPKLQTPSGSRNRSADRQRFVNIAAGPKRADTRPINDKSFQQNAMMRVYQFFQEQPPEYANICPQPPFKNIYINTFTEMMQYLLQQFFCDVKINVLTYIVEIPILMKKLGYPGNLTSSWLKTANAPHAWCHVVAALSWLTDILIYADSSMDNDLDKYFVPYPENICDSKALFHYALDSFVPWNHQDTVKMSMLDSNFIANMRQHHVSQKEIEALEAEVDALQQDLDDPADKSQIAEEKALEEEWKELKKKNRNYRESTDKKKHEIAATKKTLEEIEWKMEQLVKESKGLKDQRNELDLAIASQEMTVAQAEAMRAECVRLEGQLHELDIYKQEILKATYTAEMKVASKQKELHSLCVDYNTKVLADFNDHKGLTLDTDYHSSRNLEDQWREADKNLEQLILNLKLELKNVKRDKKAHVSSIKEQEEKKKRLWEERDRLKKMRVEAEQKMERLMEGYKAQEEELKKQHDEIQIEVQQLVAKRPDIEKTKAKLKTAQDTADRLKKELVFIQEQGAAFIERLVQSIRDREESMAKKIAYMPKLKQ